MNGKKYEDLGFELGVRLFKTSHERGSSLAGHSTSTTGLFSKKFNNLFVKNFPKPNFTEDELKVSPKRRPFSDQIFRFRPFLNPLARSSVSK